MSATHVLIISTNYGTETRELLVPLEELKKEGFDVVVAAPTTAPIQTLESDKQPGEKVTPDATLEQVKAEDFDGIVIPGGTINADALRGNERAQNLVKEFAKAGKPVAAICHAPWLLVETGLAKSKRLTSYPSIRTDISNAGGHWVNAEVVIDDTEGWSLITSRSPADLGAFTSAVREALDI